MSFFTNEVIDQCNLIYCPSELDGIAVKQFELVSKTWTSLDVKLHLLDMKDVAEIAPNSYRTFIQYKQNLEQNGVKLFSINLSAKVFQDIKNAGLIGTFSPAPKVEAVFEQLGLSVPKKLQQGIDVQFINIFFKGVKMALEVQAKTSIVPQKPYSNTPGTPPKFESSLVGAIDMNSDKFKGKVILYFPKKVFLKIFENMCGEVVEEITEDIHDACGEILNIAYGQAKAELNNELGHTLQKAIPEVAPTEKFQLNTDQYDFSIMLPFETLAGPFALEILME